MRQTAFIDTSAINWFYNFGFDANRINFLLASQNLTPVIGVDTHYELTRCFKVNKEKAINLCFLLKELQPNYSCQRERLYIQEIDNLIEGKPVDPLLGYYSREILTDRLDQYSLGRVNNAHMEFIDARQFFWNDCRVKLWNQEKTRPKKALIFIDYSKYCIQQLRLNLSIFQQWINLLTKKSLSEIDAIKLLDNINNFKALRTALYSHFYLNFLIIKNGNTPKEDKFTDSLQLVSASYFSVIISDDRYMIDTLVPNLNTTQKTIKVSTVMT